MTKFKVLGPLRVNCGERECTPTAPKLRQALALLVICANRLVPIDELIEELWGTDPPKSAVTTTQTYIHQLRRIFGKGDPDPATGALVTKPAGYALQVDPRQVDAYVFQRRVWQGRKIMESGDAAEAGRVFRQALEMWQGPALTDVVPGRVLEANILPLEEQRLRTLELRIQADLQLGRHRELIGELRSLVTSHPLNEWFHGQLIASLSRAGRRNEALQAYQSLRRALRTELGLEPSPELQRLQHEVLSAGYPLRLTEQRLATP